MQTRSEPPSSENMNTIFEPGVLTYLNLDHYSLNIIFRIIAYFTEDKRPNMTFIP